MNKDKQTKDVVFKEAALLSLLKDEEETRRKLETRTKELEASLKRLENFRMAILNILEDAGIIKDELEKEKARFQTMLSSIEEGLILTDAKGLVVYVNSIAEELLEESEEKMKGKDFKEIVCFGVEEEEFSEKDRQKCPINRVLEKRKVFSVKTSDNWFFSSKSGKRFYVAFTASPIMVNKKLTGAVIAFRNVTIEREVDKMKTEFISIASHQLKTPLSAMKWFLEMLLGGDAGELNEEQGDFVKEIYRSNERIIELVNALLNVSRIESGRLTIDPRPTDMVALAADAAKNIKIFTVKKNQNFIFEVKDKDIPLVNIDPQIIYQAMINLLSNAVKYTPEKGNVKFTVQLKSKDVLFEIADNGYGIPANQQGRVFQKFFRGDNIVSRVHEGTGLGLYTAKSLIENSGGKIGFKSKENEGSLFWLTVPLAGSKPKKGEKKLEKTNL